MREHILCDIERTIEYRKDKAERFPDDSRNQQSVDALSALYDFVEKVEDSHPAFVAFSFACQDDEANFRISGLLSELLGRWGFDCKVEPVDFLQSLTDIASKAAAGAIVSGNSTMH